MEGMVDNTVENAERQLIFIGFTAMSDPVRTGVPEAVAACHAAGIRILMITGDYPLTAQCIAKEIGLGQWEGRSNPVYQGADLMETDDEGLKTILKTGEPVFARVSPDQKLRIVTLLKEMGEIVAVTGDGVNDGPALRRADIGIAMGQRGTDVAREAAHMVLADDHFPTIIAAIEEGRAIFENIKRFAAYVLNSNPQELYPYILWMLVPDIPLAMTVMGVLAVDVGTDLIPAMGLGIERPEKGIMEMPPRKKNEKLLSIKFILRSYFVQGSILALACYATYFFTGWYMGWVAMGKFFSGMPPSAPRLDMNLASDAYLMSLTGYFFPTVATQIANVLCKRSWKISIFSEAFIDPGDREKMLEGIGNRGGVGALCSRFLEHHPIVFNFISNPLIDLGIAFEIGLCILFFYTGLSRIYYFAPVPWLVYLFAFHGAVVLFVFEETKKYFRRRGHPLEFLG
jgi:sodium/potassium-transporting ATPase subunit alpha